MPPSTYHPPVLRSFFIAIASTLELDFIGDELRCSGKGRGLGFTKADEFKAAKVLPELVIHMKFPIVLNFNPILASTGFEKRTRSGCRSR